MPPAEFTLVRTALSAKADSAVLGASYFARWWELGVQGIKLHSIVDSYLASPEVVDTLRAFLHDVVPALRAQTCPPADTLASVLSGVTSIRLNGPSPLGVVPGDTFTLVPEARDSTGSVVADPPIVWVVGDTTVMRVHPTRANSFIATHFGVSSLWARVGRATAALQVFATEPTGVFRCLAGGDSLIALELHASAPRCVTMGAFRVEDGAWIPAAHSVALWASSDTSVATVVPRSGVGTQAVIVANGGGTATITASSAGGTAVTFVVTVSDLRPQVRSFRFTPMGQADSIFVEVDAFQPVSITALDSVGNVMPGITPTLTMADTAVATVDLFFESVGGRAPGRTWLHAQVLAVHDSIPVIVSSGLDSLDFGIPDSTLAGSTLTLSYRVLDRHGALVSAARARTVSLYDPYGTLSLHTDSLTIDAPGGFWGGVTARVWVPWHGTYRDFFKGFTIYDRLLFPISSPSAIVARDATANPPLKVRVMRDSSAYTSVSGETVTWSDGTGATWQSPSDVQGYAELPWRMPSMGTDTLYTVRATVQGGTVARRVVTFALRLPPRPTATATVAPSTAVEGDTVAFDGSASTESLQRALTYAWAFSDGGSATTALVRRPFSAGSWQGALTVRNPDGRTATVTRTVTIVAKRTVALVDGDNQAIPRGTTAWKPLKVLVTRTGGVVASGDTVAWKDSDLRTWTSLTDASGYATLAWPMPASGASTAYTVTAKVQGGTRTGQSVTFALSANTTVGSIRLSRGPVDSLTLGVPMPVSATALTASGFTISATPAWTTSNGDAAYVSGGMVLPGAYAATWFNTVDLTASSGGKSATFAVKLFRPSVVRVPGAKGDTITIGTSQSANFQVQVRDVRGNLLSSATHPVTWVSNGSGYMVFSSPTNDTWTRSASQAWAVDFVRLNPCWAWNSGHAVCAADTVSVFAAHATASVVPTSPPAATLTTPVQFTATARDAKGAVLPGVVFNWYLQDWYVGLGLNTSGLLTLQRSTGGGYFSTLLRACLQIDTAVCSTPLFVQGH